jgi:hypothetical protein
MELVVFQTGREELGTTCSVQLAAGAHELGWRPLHIHVLSPGRFPALNGVKAIPFETPLLMGDDIDSVAPSA